jgi:hypothetical protein
VTKAEFDSVESRVESVENDVNNGKDTSISIIQGSTYDKFKIVLKKADGSELVSNEYNFVEPKIETITISKDFNLYLKDISSSRYGCYSCDVSNRNTIKTKLNDIEISYPSVAKTYRSYGSWYYMRFSTSNMSTIEDAIAKAFKCDCSDINLRIVVSIYRKYSSTFLLSDGGSNGPVSYTFNVSIKNNIATATFVSSSSSSNYIEVYTDSTTSDSYAFEMEITSITKR